MFNVRVTCIVGEAPALQGVIASLYYRPCPGFYFGNLRRVQCPCALYADFGFFFQEKFQKSLSISGSSRVAPRARQQPRCSPRNLAAIKATLQMKIKGNP